MKLRRGFVNLKLTLFLWLINCSNVITNKKVEISRELRLPINNSEKEKENNPRSEASNTKFVKKDEEKNLQRVRNKSIFESLEEEIEALLNEIKEGKN